MRKMLFGLMMLAATGAVAATGDVITMPLEEGVTMDDAVTSMKLRANLHNLMLVSHQPLSEQLTSMGIQSRRLEIFQFCDPGTAARMVEAAVEFAAYIPCRIALVETADQPVLVMLDMAPMLESEELPPALREEARTVWQNLMDIMRAGSGGEL